MLADRVAGMLKDHDWRGLSDLAVAAAVSDLVWAGRLTNDARWHRCGQVSGPAGGVRRGPTGDGRRFLRHRAHWLELVPGQRRGPWPGAPGQGSGAKGDPGAGFTRAGRRRCGPGEQYRMAEPLGPDRSTRRGYACRRADADRAADRDGAVVAAADRDRSTQHSHAIAQALLDRHGS